MSHAVLVAAEADNYEALLFGEDSLVDVPAGVEVGKNNRSHVGDGCCGVVDLFRVEVVRLRGRL